MVKEIRVYVIPTLGCYQRLSLLFNSICITKLLDSSISEIFSIGVNEFFQLLYNPSFDSLRKFRIMIKNSIPMIKNIILLISSLLFFYFTVKQILFSQKIVKRRIFSIFHSKTQFFSINSTFP